MASENDSTKLPFNGETGNARNRGKSRNGKGVKKVPQRGVGVEKLEKMRIEESLKIFHQQQQQLVLSYGGFQFPQQQQVMINNNNSNNVVGSGFAGSGFSTFVGNNKSGFGVGASSSSSWFGRNPFENSSKDLSSIPNLNHPHQSHDLCLKKTRLNEESIMMRGANYAKRDMPLEIWNNPHNHVHHDFLGFVPQPQLSVSASQNLNEKTCLNEENIMRGTNARRNMPLEDWNHHHGFLGFMPQHKPSFSAYDPTQNHDECVEVVAVHRKGNSAMGSGKIFMEYEFFPEKNGKSTDTIPKDFFPTATSGEASSSITATSYGDTSMAYDSLDLSLRL